MLSYYITDDMRLSTWRTDEINHTGIHISALLMSGQVDLWLCYNCSALIMTGLVRAGLVSLN